MAMNEPHMSLVSTVAFQITRTYHRISNDYLQVAPLRVDILSKCISLVTIHLRGDILQDGVEYNPFAAEMTLFICSLLWQ
jgi:hypothetical protein